MCNHEIQDKNFKYCPFCGEKLTPKEPTPTPNDDKPDVKYFWHAEYQTHDSDGSLASIKIVDDYNTDNAAKFIANQIKRGRTTFTTYAKDILKVIEYVNAKDVCEFTQRDIKEFSPDVHVQKLVNAGLIGIIGVENQLTLIRTKKGDKEKDCSRYIYEINDKAEIIMRKTAQLIRNWYENRKNTIMEDLADIEKKIIKFEREYQEVM